MDSPSSYTDFRPSPPNTSPPPLYLAFNKQNDGQDTALREIRFLNNVTTTEAQPEDAGRTLRGRVCVLLGGGGGLWVRVMISDYMILQICEALRHGDDAKTS